MIVRIHARTSLHRATRWVSHALIAGGALSIGIVVWSRIDSAFYQSVEARQFDAALAATAEIEQPAVQAPLIGRPAAPDPLLIGRLEIPRLALSAMVREGIGDSTLRRAIGHVPGTALPGQRGNLVVAGHRDTFFRGLRSIQTGDEIRITTRKGSFRYRVDSLSVVEPDDTDSLRSTATSVVTLVTCFPFDYIGAAPRRFIVRAAQF